MSAQPIISRHCLLLIFSTVASLGCEAPNESPAISSDSNTNWLTCNETSRCGGELECLCGVCTRPCTDEGDCAPLYGVCLPRRSVETCGRAAPAGSVCMPLNTPAIDASPGMRSDALTEWHASASSSSSLGDAADLLWNPPKHAIDRTARTRWSSGKPQTGDEWFELDFGEPKTIEKVTLGLGLGSAVESMNDWPRGYSLTLSDRSGALDAAPLAQGVGSAPTTVIDFAPHTGRFLLIRQTAMSDAWWSIHELEVE